MLMRRLATLLALLWLGGSDSLLAQVQGRGFPSLMRRPVESRDRDAEIAARAAQARAAVPGDEALAREVATLVTRARAAAAAFDSRVEDSRAVVEAGRGAAPGSENWVVAQEAVSALDSARYDCVTALAALDSLYAERASAEDPARANADVAVVTAPRQDVLALVDAQNDRLDALKAVLAQP